MNKLRVDIGFGVQAISRIGIANLTRMAFHGEDLRPLWHRLMAAATDDAAGAGMAMDLSIISQLLGDRETGLAIQREALDHQRLFASPCATTQPRLRVLALAAAMDIGGNTPLEFLLEKSDIELKTLYIVPGVPLPDPLPAHDVAIVTVPDDDQTREVMAFLDSVAARWPRPLLNRPSRIGDLGRDRLYRRVSSIRGLDIPMTARIARAQFSAIAAGALPLAGVLPDGVFPLIARPVGSHAGHGLDRVECASDIPRYLSTQAQDDFFISRFVDYSSPDGLFRKYRIVAIAGEPFACHMAISDQWKVWYLNAEMALSVEKRVEEAVFMEFFDDEFARRQSGPLRELIGRIGLEYLTIDCAETKDGKLLVFEADHAAIVHDMDPPNVYPYKSKQMNKIFDAFVAMIGARAQLSASQAA